MITEENLEEAKAFDGWLTERLQTGWFTSDTMMKLPDFPQCEAVTMTKERYGKLKNDLAILLGFAAVVLKCKRADVTGRRMKEYMYRMYEIRANIPKQLLKEKEYAESKVVHLNEILENCTCGCYGRWMDANFEDNGD